MSVSEKTPEEQVEPAVANGSNGNLGGQEGGEETAASGGDDATEEATDECSESEQLRDALDRAVEEKQEYLDKLQRAQAEFENIRKRLQKEKEDVVQYAASETIGSLLPIVDDFERAMETEGLDPEVKKGLELIYRRIFEVFSRAGLREVEPHDEFDPHLHFAVDRTPCEEGQKDQTIVEVYQKGYHFKDRLMRASMVKVAVEE